MFWLKQNKPSSRLIFGGRSFDCLRCKMTFYVGMLKMTLKDWLAEGCNWVRSHGPSRELGPDVDDNGLGGSIEFFDHPLELRLEHVAGAAAG